jgi:hypothetical protein
MEPISLTAAAISTLVLTKAFEKVGEKLGEKGLELSGKLLALLKKKQPNIASEIELARQQPLNIGQAHLIDAVETAAKADLEIKQAVEGLAVEVKPQLSLSTVRQVMLSGITSKGNLKAGNLTQKRSPTSSNVEQIMASNMSIEGNIELDDLTQEG